MDTFNSMLLGSGVRLDRAVTHQSVTTRLQAAAGEQNSDAAFARDKIAAKQREQAPNDSTTVGGIEIMG